MRWVMGSLLGEGRMALPHMKIRVGVDPLIRGGRVGGYVR